MKTCDVLIVGSGTGGAVCAKRLAQHEIDVIVIDRREKNLIGKKVCGNATAYNYFDELTDLVERPKDDELIWEVDGLDLYGPDMEHKIEIYDPQLSGIMIDRLKFGQRLVNDMLKEGAQLFDKTKCADILLEENKISGVKVINTQTNAKDEIKAKIVIDAGGHAAPVRNKLNSEYIEQKINKKEIGICYREIRRINNEVSQSKYASLCIDHKKAPMGYIWIFPGGDIVNIGLGVAGGMGNPNPKKLFYDFFSKIGLLNGTELLDSGGGAVPVRRPLKCLVDDHFMAIGDAAAQTNPIDAGGIGYSMLAGKYSADVAAKAIEVNDTSIDMLWSYNIKYMREIGSHQAASEVVKLLLQKMTNEELKFTLKKKIFDSKDVTKAIKEAGVKVPFFNKLKKALRGITKLGLLRRINRATKYSQEAMKLYNDYPDNKDEYNLWKDKETLLFSKIYEL